MCRRADRFRVLALLLWLVPATQALALSSDREQPVSVEADRAHLNKKSGESVYSGNVMIEQGSLRIRADRITVYTEAGQLTRIVAEGKPASYRQRPDNKTVDIIAEANRMIYEADKNLAVFENRAVLKQGGNTFSSNRIVYHIREDRVDAGKAAGVQDESDRVRIIIQPRNPPAAPEESPP